MSIAISPKEQKAHAALLAAAEKMIIAIEADPALLDEAFGRLLRVVLDDVRHLFGPSDLLSRLLARVQLVRENNPRPTRRVNLKDRIAAQRKSPSPAPPLGAFATADAAKNKGPK